MSEARGNKGDRRLPPKWVLLATGGSKDAALAARAAVDLAMGTGAELHVAHAWQAVPTTRLEAFVRARHLAEARELLEAQTALLGKAGANVAGAHLREGPTVDEMVDLAGEIGADLVVVGSPYPELPEADLEGRPRFMTGSAAKVMAKKLQENGGSLLLDPESFFVKGMEGSLRSGELDRAATWARMLLKEVEPTHLGAQQ
jgi:nucleotide-binding universal stress UspA family protein